SVFHASRAKTFRPPNMWFHEAEDAARVDRTTDLGCCRTPLISHDIEHTSVHRAWRLGSSFLLMVRLDLLQPALGALQPHAAPCREQPPPAGLERHQPVPKRYRVRRLRSERSRQGRRPRCL